MTSDHEFIDNSDPEVQYRDGDSLWVQRRCDNPSGLCREPGHAQSKVSLVFHGTGVEVVGFVHLGQHTDDLLHCTVDDNHTDSSFRPRSDSSVIFCSIQGLSETQHTLIATTGEDWYNVMIDRFHIFASTGPLSQYSTNPSPHPSSPSVVGFPVAVPSASASKALTSAIPSQVTGSSVFASSPTPLSTMSTSFVRPISSARTSTGMGSTAIDSNHTSTVVLGPSASPGSGIGSGSSKDIKAGAIVGGVTGGVILLVLCLVTILVQRGTRADPTEADSIPASCSRDDASLEKVRSQIVGPDTTLIGTTSLPHGCSGSSETLVCSSESTSCRSDAASTHAVCGTQLPAVAPEPHPHGSALKSDEARMVSAPTAEVRVQSEATPGPVSSSAEAAELRWYAPLGSQARGEALLRSASPREGSSPRASTHDVDSGLRLYEDAILPPPYSAN